MNNTIKMKMDSEEAHDLFVNTFTPYHQSKRLNSFINNQGMSTDIDLYYLCWQSKRYVESLYTVSNWYLNNIYPDFDW